MSRILIVGPLHADALAELDARPDAPWRLLYDPNEDELVEAVAEVEGIIVRTQPLTARILDAAPRLKVVSRHGVGFDNVDVAALSRREIPLTLTVTANRVTVAEHAMALILALAKRVPRFDRAVRENDWQLTAILPPWELEGRTLLLVGLGRTGSALAERARAFGLRVLVYDPYVTPEAAQAAGVTLAEDFTCALGESDIVSLHAPHTPETDSLIDAATLRAMKPSAILINTARGGLVDEVALAAALDREEIAGAGLDTFRAEPPDPGNPLLARANVILSPHVAGVTAESLRRMGLESARNTLAGLDGTLTRSVLANPEVLRAS